MARVLALNTRGELTFCTAPEDKRGMGRCNHIAHQAPGQSADEFIASIEEKVYTYETQEIKDQTDDILKLCSQYSLNKGKNPNWENIIRDLENPFQIGKDDDYEEAEMISFEQVTNFKNSGNTIQLKAYYKFRGEVYECDFGEVPEVNPDGTITIDGVNWRVLPVLEQQKAGVISYADNIVVKQKNGRDIAMIISKNPDVDTARIYGKEVPLSVVEDYFKSGGIQIEGLTSGQIYALSNIDPIAFERFPDFKEGNVRQFKDLPPDECGDLSYRRCIRYEDIVQEQVRLQLRRMGVTFRTNLAARKKLEEQGKLDDMTKEQLDAKYPLFYQVNLTENIKSDLIKRSNVQNTENLNPIAALSQSQKISFTGPGGWHKDKAPYELRLPHPSHEGLIEPMDVSSGKNVGLTAVLTDGYIGEDRFIHKKDPKDCLSPGDFIPYKNFNDPSRGQMAIAHMKQACPIVGGEDPEIKTPAWDKIKGAKLGVNLPIAYVSCADVFEDGVIISESAANKMATIQSHNYELKNTEFNKAALSSLKVGQRVERKDKIGNVEVKTGGIIKSISDTGFEVETYYKMTPGDKLAGRHGNKSVVSRVLPDDQMPKIVDKDGKLIPAGIVMSPLSVTSRKNLGQIKETNEAFGNGPVIDKVNTVILNDGTRVQATAGRQYILRLNHICEKKLSSHADEMGVSKEAEGCRLGEMESILLSTNPERLKILNYLRHQEQYDAHNKLHHLLKAVGVQMDGVNWKDE